MTAVWDSTFNNGAGAWKEILSPSTSDANRIYNIESRAPYVTGGTTPVTPPPSSTDPTETQWVNFFEDTKRGTGTTTQPHPCYAMYLAKLAGFGSPWSYTYNGQSYSVNDPLEIPSIVAMAREETHHDVNANLTVWPYFYIVNEIGARGILQILMDPYLQVSAYNQILGTQSFPGSSLGNLWIQAWEADSGYGWPNDITPSHATRKRVWDWGFKRMKEAAINGYECCVADPLGNINKYIAWEPSYRTASGANRQSWLNLIDYYASIWPTQCYDWVRASPSNQTTVTSSNLTATSNINISTTNANNYVTATTGAGTVVVNNYTNATFNIGKQIETIGTETRYSVRQTYMEFPTDTLGASVIQGAILQIYSATGLKEAVNVYQYPLTTNPVSKTTLNTYDSGFISSYNTTLWNNNIGYFPALNSAANFQTIIDSALINKTGYTKFILASSTQNTAPLDTDGTNKNSQIYYSAVSPANNPVLIVWYQLGKKDPVKVSSSIGYIDDPSDAFVPKVPITYTASGPNTKWKLTINYTQDNDYYWTPSNTNPRQIFITIDARNNRTGAVLTPFAGLVPANTSYTYTNTYTNLGSTDDTYTLTLNVYHICQYFGNCP